VYDERILQLHFVEFLEALARSAEKFSPAPVQLAVNGILSQNFINNISSE